MEFAVRLADGRACFLIPARRGLLLQLLSKFYERTSVFITTNLSFGELASVVAETKMITALLDGLTHRSHFVETEKRDRCPFLSSLLDFLAAGVSPCLHHRATLFYQRVSRIGRANFVCVRMRQSKLTQMIGPPVR